MIEELFNILYNAMMGSVWLALFSSFVWGVLSILLSPCHLSSIPIVVGYIASQGKISVERTFNISLIFSLGILITIGLIGVITASLGRLMGDIGVYGNYFVAVIFFIVGKTAGTCDTAATVDTADTAYQPYQRRISRIRQTHQHWGIK